MNYTYEVIKEKERQIENYKNLMETQCHITNFYKEQLEQMNVIAKERLNSIRLLKNKLELLRRYKQSPKL